MIELTTEEQQEADRPGMCLALALILAAQGVVWFAIGYLSGWMTHL